MSIPGVTDELLKEVLSENLTPSDSIKTPDRLFGRGKVLRIIDRAFSSPGRQIFIFGDRGVGRHHSRSRLHIFILALRTLPST